MSDPYNERFSVYVNDVQRYLKAAEQETCDQLVQTIPCRMNTRSTWPTSSPPCGIVAVRRVSFWASRPAFESAGKSRYSDLHPDQLVTGIKGQAEHDVLFGVVAVKHRHAVALPIGGLARCHTALDLFIAPRAVCLLEDQLLHSLRRHFCGHILPHHAVDLLIAS